ncbi:uncharacterized protein HKW66_Vig0115460 [Vigna angularis]|uniref:Uncharacterized protein n=1 Tax=Phaseolus angularis TaxID=3914 RepID=A0A8T0KY78_PHAAN|nr:uncharacterized protein HKW66_Vig0115460 [Vigna angularis]
MEIFFVHPVMQITDPGSRRFCSRRWTRSDVASAGHVATRTNDDGKACMAAAHSATEASCGVVLPWPPDTASGATVVTAPLLETLPTAAEHSAPWTATATRNQNRAVSTVENREEATRGGA